MPIHRTESRDFDNRRNTDWIGENGFWLFYALLIFIIRLLVGLGLLIFTSKQSHYTWTIVNGGHALITFYIMHWAKGTPFWLPAEDQDRSDSETFWEQIDFGRQYTQKRKIFTIIPVVIFLLASYEISWTPTPVLLNFGFLLLSVIPKLGALHHVRLMGINAD